MWIGLPVKSPALSLGSDTSPADTCCPEALRVLSLHPLEARVASKWPSKDRSGLGHGTYPSRFLFLTKGQLFSFVSSMLEKVPWQVLSFIRIWPWGVQKPEN